jgi:hypothetical protein
MHSDGRDTNGRIGASSWCSKLNRQIGGDLGPRSKITVYAAELLGILYSPIKVVTVREVKTITLFVDNQAAIKSVQSPERQSGH